MIELPIENRLVNVSIRGRSRILPEVVEHAPDGSEVDWSRYVVQKRTSK